MSLLYLIGLNLVLFEFLYHLKKYIFNPRLHVRFFKVLSMSDDNIFTLEYFSRRFYCTLSYKLQKKVFEQPYDSISTKNK